MGRMNLRCACGQTFAVDSSLFDTHEFTRCPGCGKKVGIDGPILEGPEQRPRPRPKLPNMKKVHVILGGIGIGVVLFFGILIVFLMMSEGKRDKEVTSSGHAPRAVDRAQRGSVRYPTDRLVDYAPPPVQPAPQPAVKPPEIKPLPPLPPLTDRAAVPPPKPPIPVPAPAPQAAPEPLPGELIQRVREELLSLPQYYLRSLLPGDSRGRVEARIAAGKGSPQDVAFLESLLSDPQLESARDEYRNLRNRFAALEREAFTTLPMDQLTLADGRKLTGKILEVTESSVRLERRVSKGVGGVMTFPRSQVREVGKGKGLGGEFKKRWEAAKPGPAAKLEELMAWCRSGNLKIQADMVCHALLVRDPGNAMARRSAQLGMRPIGAAAGPDAPPPTTGPTITYQGRQWAPKDLKDKLLRSGYALIGGSWFRGKDHSIGVPGLFRYARQTRQPVSFSSTTAPINHDSEVSYKSVYNVSSRSFSQKPEIKLIRRFYSPTLTVKYVSVGLVKNTATMKTYMAIDKTDPKPGTMLVGEVAISVPLEKPLIEASVKLLTEVRSGGKITVYLRKGLEKVQLATITGKSNRSIPIPSEHILGTTQLNLVVEMRMIAAYKTRSVKHPIRPFRRGDTRGRGSQAGIELIHNQSIPDYPTRLFPSNSNTHEVFRLRAKLAEPAVGLDRLFEPFPEVLR